MNRFLLISVSLLTILAGCEKQPGGDGDDRAIGFGVTATKAGMNLPSGTFSVIGKYFAGSSWNTSEAKDVFSTSIQNVSTDGTGACTYSPLQYWKKSSIYRFRAVSPIAPDVVKYSDSLDGEAVITGFEVNAAAKTDLLLSNLAAVSIGSSIGEPARVGLEFRHLLCNVHIQICEDSSLPEIDPGCDEFTIIGVSLAGMPDKGTYTGTSTSGTWNTSSAGSLSCVNNTPHIAPNNFDDTDSETTKSEIWPDGLLLIPQTINSSNAVNLVVTYQVSHDGGAPSKKSVSIPIPDITWEAGKKYVYQLAMNEEYYIQFGNISVESWGSTQSSGSIIIR